MEYEAPKRFTAVNDVTGALIKSKSDNQDAYSTGYDILKSGNVSKEQPETKFPIAIQLTKPMLNHFEGLAEAYDLTVSEYISALLEGMIKFRN